MSGPPIRRLYYSTQEVCDIVRIRPHELKQWCVKFSELKPSISKTGRRLYKPKDLQTVQRIKMMVDEGHSDDEIEYILNHPQTAPLLEKSRDAKLSLSRIIQELEEILHILQTDTTGEHKSCDGKMNPPVGQ